METWKIDPAHSEVQFKVKHLVVSNVTGQFKNFDAHVETSNPDFTDAKINFSAEIESLSTGNEQRDGHVKSAEFFDAAAHPKMEFTSTSFTKVDEENYKLVGKLNLKGVEKEIELNVNFGGLAKDFYGNNVAGFEINGKINRKDFGLTWDGVTEAGNIVLSDEVKIHINAELIKQTV